MKVVINKCFGGFSLSEAAAKACIEAGMTCSTDWDAKADFRIDESPKYGMSRYYAPRHDDKAFRTHPIVVEVIERLGAEICSGSCAQLAIVDIPFSGTDGWHIDEYDGQERIAADHQTWG